MDVIQPRERPSAAGERASFLSNIDTLLPDIRSRAGETERLGPVPDDIIQALTKAGVFRATQPLRWGGLELDHPTYYEGMIRVASACASTGWVASVVGVHPWQIGLFDDRAQRDMWEADPDARASSSFAPTGKVRAADGGYVLSGRWHFSSGVDHCTWVMLGGVVPDAEGVGEFRTFLVPSIDYSIDHESWNVTGLAGTGSKDVVVSDAFVPEYRTHRVADVIADTNPGYAVNDRPYFRLPWRLVFGSTIAAPAIGAALGAIEAFIAVNSHRVSLMGGPPVATNPALHRPLVHALTEVDAARKRMADNWTSLAATRVAGEAIPFIERARCFYELTHAHASCSAAIFELVGVNGGRTMHVDGALQRHFRDLLSMRNHPAANIELATKLYAEARLGLPEPKFSPAQRFVL